MNEGKSFLTGRREAVKLRNEYLKVLLNVEELAERESGNCSGLNLGIWRKKVKNTIERKEMVEAPKNTVVSSEWSHSEVLEV